MTERGLASMDGAPACPFVAFGDDREGRSTSPDHRHRCFAESPPAPRALAHQEAYCLSSAFPVCPTFQDWARREAAHARGDGERPETAPTAAPILAAAGDPDQPKAAGPTGSGAMSGDPGDRSRDPDGAGDGTDAGARGNAPRDRAAPPPWATGAGAAGAGLSRSAGAGSGGQGPAGAAGRTEGQGLAGSAADRLAGGPPPATTASGPGSSGLAAGTASAGVAAWSASAAGSASAAPDDELAGLVRGRSADQPPGRPQSDSQPPPARTGRRPTVSSTRPSGDPITGPSWERMRNYEAYPQIRSGRGVRGLPRVGVLAGAVAIAALALFMLPALLGIGGGGPSSSASPIASGAGATSTPEIVTPAAPTPQVYRIQDKDNLLKVAKKFGVTLDQLLAANPQITNPDKISLGQEIIIPTASAAPPSTTPSGSATP